MAHRILPLCLLLATAFGPLTPLRAQSRETEIVETAAGVLNEVMVIPGRSIPTSLLNNAEGVAIIPNLVKGGFVLGVRHGRGVMLVRDEQRAWRPPIFISLTGGSVGWQAGIQSTDLILVFKTKRSVSGLMNGKLTLGVDAAAAAGPVGRKAAASTDAKLAAEILSYSKSRGLFAGVSIDGSSIQVDHAAGAAFYQPPGTLPAAAVKLMNTLAGYTSAPQVVSDELASETLLLAPANPQPEPLGQQLLAQHRQLVTLLEPSWRTYLDIPTDAQGQPSQDLNLLRTALERFDAVARDPRYAPLASRPEFATTHGLLRQYVASQSAGASRIPLPPPPGSATPTRR